MDYHETLQALKDSADAKQVVEVHVRAVGADEGSSPVLMQGALSTKWHPEMTDPPPAVVYFVGEARWSSFIVSRADFEDATRSDDGHVRVVVGGVVLDVSEATLLES